VTGYLLLVAQSSIAVDSRSLRQAPFFNQADCVTPVAMSAELLRQLQTFKAKHNIAQQPKHGKVSFLYDWREARSVEPQAIAEAALSSFQDLVAQDPSLEEFVDLFEVDKDGYKGRDFLTSEENDELNNNIEKLLMHLSKHLLTEQGQTCLELLISRYEVQTYNMEALLLAGIPFHDSPVFARLTKIVKWGDDSQWIFLARVRKTGEPLKRQHLVHMLRTSPSLWRTICDYTRKTVKLGIANRPLLTTVNLVFLEALAEAHKFTFDLAPALFPLISAATKKGSTDRQAFSFAVTMMIPLIASSSLSDGDLCSLLARAMKHAPLPAFSDVVDIVALGLRFSEKESNFWVKVARELDTRYDAHSEQVLEAIGKSRGWTLLLSGLVLPFGEAPLLSAVVSSTWFLGASPSAALTVCDSAVAIIAKGRKESHVAEVLPQLYNNFPLAISRCALKHKCVKEVEALLPGGHVLDAQLLRHLSTTSVSARDEAISQLLDRESTTDGEAKAVAGLMVERVGLEPSHAIRMKILNAGWVWETATTESKRLALEGLLRKLMPARDNITPQQYWAEVVAVDDRVVEEITIIIDLLGKEDEANACVSAVEVMRGDGVKLATAALPSSTAAYPAGPAGAAALVQASLGAESHAPTVHEVLESIEELGLSKSVDLSVYKMLSARTSDDGDVERLMGLMMNNSACKDLVKGTMHDVAKRPVLLSLAVTRHITKAFRMYTEIAGPKAFDNGLFLVCLLLLGSDQASRHLKSLAQSAIASRSKAPAAAMKDSWLLVNRGIDGAVEGKAYAALRKALDERATDVVGSTAVVREIIAANGGLIKWILQSSGAVGPSLQQQCMGLLSMVAPKSLIKNAAVPSVTGAAAVVLGDALTSCDDDEIVGRFVDTVTAANGAISDDLLGVLPNAGSRLKPKQLEKLVGRACATLPSPGAVRFLAHADGLSVKVLASNLLPLVSGKNTVNAVLAGEALFQQSTDLSDADRVVARKALVKPLCTLLLGNGPREDALDLVCLSILGNICQKEDLELVKPVVLKAATKKQQVSAALRICGAIKTVALLRETLGQMKSPLETPQLEQLKTIVKAIVVDGDNSAAEVLDALVTAPQEAARIPASLICDIARDLSANGAALVLLMAADAPREDIEAWISGDVLPLDISAMVEALSTARALFGGQPTFVSTAAVQYQTVAARVVSGVVLALTNLGVPEGTPEEYATLLVALHSVTGDSKSKKAAKIRTIANEAAGSFLRAIDASCMISTLIALVKEPSTPSALFSQVADAIEEAATGSWQQQYLSVPSEIQEECVAVVIERASQEGSVAMANALWSVLRGLCSALSLASLKERVTKLVGSSEPLASGEMPLTNAQLCRATTILVKRMGASSLSYLSLLLPSLIAALSVKGKDSTELQPTAQCLFEITGACGQYFGPETAAVFQLCVSPEWELAPIGESLSESAKDLSHLLQMTAQRLARSQPIASVMESVKLLIIEACGPKHTVPNDKDIFRLQKLMSLLGYMFSRTSADIRSLAIIRDPLARLLSRVVAVVQATHVVVPPARREVRWCDAEFGWGSEALAGLTVQALSEACLHMRLADVGAVMKTLGKHMKRGGWLAAESNHKAAPQTAVWLSLATELCSRGGQEIGVAVLQLMSGDVLEVFKKCTEQASTSKASNKKRKSGEETAQEGRPWWFDLIEEALNLVAAVANVTAEISSDGETFEAIIDAVANSAASAKYWPVAYTPEAQSSFSLAVIAIGKRCATDNQVKYLLSDLLRPCRMEPSAQVKLVLLRAVTELWKAVGGPLLVGMSEVSVYAGELLEDENAEVERATRLMLAEVGAVSGENLLDKLHS
ncbi:HEAT repeat-containing protein 1, partial [Perkinsus chesapeaki]